MSYFIVVNAPFFRGVHRSYRRYAQTSVSLTRERIATQFDFTSESRAAQAPAGEAKILMYAAYGRMSQLHPTTNGAGCILGAGKLVGSGLRTPADSAEHASLWTLSLEAYRDPNILTHCLKYHLHSAGEPLRRDQFRELELRRRNFARVDASNADYESVHAFWNLVAGQCTTCMTQ